VPAPPAERCRCAQRLAGPASTPDQHRELLHGAFAATVQVALGDLLVTGPTGTNVDDLRIVLIGARGDLPAGVR
jgi:hypothetical protein